MMCGHDMRDFLGLTFHPNCEFEERLIVAITVRASNTFSAHETSTGNPPREIVRIIVKVKLITLGSSPQGSKPTARTHELDLNDSSDGCSGNAAVGEESGG